MRHAKSWVFALLLATSCGDPAAAPAKGPNAARASAKSDLARLAAALDSGPMAPVWPTLPAGPRHDLERGLRLPSTSSARIAAARERISTEKGTLYVDESAELRSRVRGYLEALYMLEPMAFGEQGPDARDATLLLSRLWGVINVLDQFAPSLQRPSDGKTDAALDAPMLQKLVEMAERTQCGHAARVLRQGTFDEPVHTMLTSVAFNAQAREDFTRSRLVWEELAKRVPETMSAAEWIGAGRASLALDDIASADELFARARALVTTPVSDTDALTSVSEKRRYFARLRAAQTQRDTIVALGKVAKGTSIDAELARADRLEEMGRKREARQAYEALGRKAPTESRVLVRLSRLAMLDGFAAGKPNLEIMEASARPLDVPNVTDATGEFLSWSLGVFGTLSAQRFANAGGKMADLAKMIAELRVLNERFARFEPGRAAAVGFMMDRLSSLSSAKGDVADALLKELRATRPQLVELIKRHPEAADLYRILYAMAPFAESVDQSMALLAMTPTKVDEEETTLHLQRATVATMLAAVTRREAIIARAHELAAAIPPSDDADAEGARAALLADGESLHAEAGHDPAGWARASALYTMARDLVKPSSRCRILNNLGYSQMMEGHADEAQAAWRLAFDLPSDRRWVPALTSAFAGSSERSDRFRITDTVRGMFLQAKQEVPGLVSAWHAELAESPEARRESAKAAMASLDKKVIPASPDAPYPNEIEASSSLNFSTKGRSHVLDVRFEGWLWLVLKPAAKLGEIQKVASASAPPTKAAPKRK